MAPENQRNIRFHCMRSSQRVVRQASHMEFQIFCACSCMCVCVCVCVCVSRIFKQNDNLCRVPASSKIAYGDVEPTK